MIRRIAAVGLFVAGLALMVVPVADHVFTATGPSQKMLDAFRPTMTHASIASLRTGVEQLGTAGNELSTQVLPTVAGALRVPAPVLQQSLQTQYPDVAKGLHDLPAIVARFRGLTTTLDAQVANFHGADTMPVSGAPVTVLPWGFVFVGLLTLGAGWLLWRRADRRGPIAAVVVGGLVLVACVALTLPHKAVQSDHVMTAFKPVLTSTQVDQARLDLATMTAMGAQLRTGLLPGLAQQLKLPPEALQATLARQAPAVAAVLTNLPTEAATFDALVNKMAANIDNYRKATELPSTTFLAWVLVAGGAAGVVAGLVGLAVPGEGRPEVDVRAIEARRRREPAETDTEAKAAERTLS